MSAVNNIIYQSVVYLAPVLLCVLGGIFAYKANVLNIALEGMMMAGAFVSMLIANLTGSVPAGYLSAFAACLLLSITCPRTAARIQSGMMRSGAKSPPPITLPARAVESRTLPSAKKLCR